MNHYFNLRACNMEKAPSKSEESPMERTYDHLTDVDETIHVGLSVALAPDSSQKDVVLVSTIMKAKDINFSRN